VDHARGDPKLRARLEQLLHDDTDTS
jgi:hypothetical protein